MSSSRDVEKADVAASTLGPGDPSPEPVVEDEVPLHTVDFGFLPIPKYLQYYHSRPPNFNLALNILFALGSTFACANLYYSQPLLIQMSKTFNVSYDMVSQIPTLTQAGYAGGLLFVTPLGDLVRRRPMILLLSTLALALSIGLPITNSFRAFESISFLVGFTSLIPQIMTPFAADLAPPHKRAQALAVVLSGILMGVLFARVFAGLIGNFASWRVVYWAALGLQGGTLVAFYFMLPDFPAKDTGLGYHEILYTMAKFVVTEPVLLQGALVTLATSVCFANFWTTLTFLLGGPIYHYSTVVIGLFGLVGMGGVALSPFLGRFIDHMVPWYATLISSVGATVFYGIQTGTAGLNVAAVIIVCFGIDVLRQMQQVSVATAVLGLDPLARSRMNAVILISVFAGQIIGTSVGTIVFNRHGWRAAAALSTGWEGFAVLVLLARGPHCPRYTWVGWKGGFAVRKAKVGASPPAAPPAPSPEDSAQRDDDEKASDEKSEDVIAGVGPTQ